ncbi:coagulation factor 5/8 type domain-containing protein [Sarocladium strictum]
MRFTTPTGLLCGLLSAAVANAKCAANSKAIFLFKDVMQSNTTALKTYFNELLIFRVGVLESGDLWYYATGDAAEEVDVELVVDGEYVGGDAIAQQVRGYKEGDTIVDRVEVSILSYGGTFESIHNLMDTNGTGPDSILYKNWKALKDAWDLDGLNDDDEGNYIAEKTIPFAQMMGEIGYKYSIAPYTNIPFWAEITGALSESNPGLLDRVYLQVYDGGAANTPVEWSEALDMKIVPMEWVTNDAKPQYGTTPEECREQFERWVETGTMGGAGYWNEYDIERMGLSYDEYGTVLSDIFG